METFADALSAFGSTAFRWCLAGFVILNATAAVVVFMTRNRQVVNRWTSRFVAANLLLLAAGTGMPLVAGALRLVVNAVAATQSGVVGAKGK